MQFRKLGTTGLDVSALCLGCMSFGDPQAGAHPWTLDEAAGRPIFRAAVEAGINFFDTADSYSAGTSERQVGSYLKEFVRRDEAVVATKVYFPEGAGGGERHPNRQGLSRKAILAGIDNSLTRLGLDYVDLYQIHRWDYGTPIEETMEALHDVVKAGKARYIGASSMFAWQFAKAQQVAKAHGWTRFVTMQNHLNLLYREEEREMIPLCLDQGVGLIPWSPLARGRLTRDWEAGTNRSGSDGYATKLYAASEAADRAVVEAVAQVASARGVPRAQVALAWVAGKRGVSAPIIGVTKPSHLADAVAALSLDLSSDEIAALEAPYIPHAVVGIE